MGNYIDSTYISGRLSTQKYNSLFGGLSSAQINTEITIAESEFEAKLKPYYDNEDMPITPVSEYIKDIVLRILVFKQSSNRTSISESDITIYENAMKELNNLASRRAFIIDTDGEISDNYKPMSVTAGRQSQSITRNKKQLSDYWNGY